MKKCRGSTSRENAPGPSSTVDQPQDDPQPSTSRRIVDADSDGADDEDNNSSRYETGRLRSRKLNLNRLSSNLTCPQVCKFQHCGIQLRDGDSLEWHYQGHIAQEIEKLKKIRVKKLRTDQDAQDFQNSRRLVRNSAVEKIRFHRERRKALARSNNTILPDVTTARPLECPVCDHSEQNEEDHASHVEACLRTSMPHLDEPIDYESDVNVDDGGLDVDSMDGFESYTWAGQTRIRATSLVEGGLRGAGFMTITRGDEDAELDIENVDEEPGGSAQFSEEDVIQLNQSSTAEADDEEIQTDNQILDAAQKETNDEKTSSNTISTTDIPIVLPHSSEDLKKLCQKLIKDNTELKKQTVCKICMDVAYNKPLVSLVCWHVHCEECWLRALGAKKLCPQCKVIIQPKDLRRIFL